MGNDDIDMKPFEELVHETNQIYQSAYALLLPEAEQICSKNCSQSEVEHLSDYALSFCGSPEVLVSFLIFGIVFRIGSKSTLPLFLRISFDPG